MPAESFPCLVCGKVLTRSSDDYEAQPNDGLMCQASGNYGSTVFDPFDLSLLAFNVCDSCMVKAAEQGRVMVTRYHQPINTDHMQMIGRERVVAVYVPWKPNLPGDGREVFVGVDEIEAYAKRDGVELKFDIDTIKDYVASQEAKP